MTGRRIGYARVSTTEQNLDLQIDALRRVGCQQIMRETVSGDAENRPILEATLDMLNPGDTLVVWRLDRLARSVAQLITIVERLGDHGVDINILHEKLDTSTPNGKMMFHIFAALSQFEKDLIGQRTRAGLAAARQRGATLGRPKTWDDKKAKLAQRLFEEGRPKSQIARDLSVSRSTLHRMLSEEA